MKITLNEVEVVKHQSVIAPIVVVVVLFCLRPARRYSVTTAARQSRSAASRHGRRLTGCCCRLQKLLPLRRALSGERDDRVKINKQ